MKNEIETQILRARVQFESSDDAEAIKDHIDVKKELIRLLYADQWKDLNDAFFHGWMKKMDIAKKHFTAYLSNWKPTQTKTTIDKDLYQLTGLLAIKYLDNIAGDASKKGQLLKTCNALFKVLDRIDSIFELTKHQVNDHITQLLDAHEPTSCIATAASGQPNLDTKTLPITVLFSEGPIARAYLETIKSMGLKVKKIIKLVSSVDLVSKKPAGRLLPTSMRANYLANKQYKQMFYWPSLMKRKNETEVKALQQEVSEVYGFNQSTLTDATLAKDLACYSNEVESILIKGLNDANLLEKMEAESSDVFLFTGGGIVPDALLAIPNKKLIHVHPGFLPEVRGADCVLWSQLLHQTTSATAFFLAPGIDVGDVIRPCWLPQLKLETLVQNDMQSNYRLIYGFLDPWVRSYVLRYLINNTNGLTQIDATPQSESEGMTYHFMHNKMRVMAMDQFKNSGTLN